MTSPAGVVGLVVSGLFTDEENIINRCGADDDNMFFTVQ